MLAMMLMMSAALAFAQDGRTKGGADGRRMQGRGHGGGEGFLRGLDLSEAQQAQIKQISDRYDESTRGLRDQLRGLRRSSDSTDGAFNEAAVRQAATARANLEVELEVARARMKSEIHAVLTPEQKAQLSQQREAMKQRKQQWMNKRSEGGSTIQQ
jgi:Spy/CpxP family protein refolding chaperone